MLTGKEALIALANGEEVEYKTKEGGWHPIPELLDSIKMRTKPRTITINGIELPKPSFTCHSTSNSNIIEIGFNTEQEARDFHLQFRRAWK